MFCSKCGAQFEVPSLSCPACDAPATTVDSQVRQRPPMLRSLTHRVFGGVCAALALHYGWKRSRVRLVTALFILFTGVGSIAYLAAWMVIPQEPYPISQKST
jgi:phage shock protein C